MSDLLISAEIIWWTVGEVFFPFRTLIGTQRPWSVLNHGQGFWRQPEHSVGRSPVALCNRIQASGHSRGSTWAITLSVPLAKATISWWLTLKRRESTEIWMRLLTFQLKVFPVKMRDATARNDGRHRIEKLHAIKSERNLLPSPHLPLCCYHGRLLSRCDESRRGPSEWNLASLAL